MANRKVTFTMNQNDPKELFKCMQGTGFSSIKEVLVLPCEINIVSAVVVHIETNDNDFYRMYITLDDGRKFYVSSDYVINTITEWCSLVPGTTNIRCSLQSKPSKKFPNVTYIQCDIL